MRALISNYGYGVGSKVRRETEKRLESEKRQLDQRSNVYRLHYQNQYNTMRGVLREMVVDRNFVGESQELSADDASGSLQVISFDKEQLLRDRNELVELLREHRSLHTDEIEEWKKKFSVADATISRLKTMVTKANEESNNLRNIVQHLRAGESSLALVEENDMETNVYPDRERKLNSEVVRLQKALADREEQARKDQEEDTVLLQEMNQKFDSLMANYQKSCADRDERYDRQQEEMKSKDIIVAELKASNQSANDQIESLLIAVQNMERDISRQVDALSEKDLEIVGKNSEIQKLESVCQEMSLRITDMTSECQTMKEALTDKSNIVLDFQTQIAKLQSSWYDCENKYAQCLNREKAMGLVCVRLRSQLDGFKAGNAMVRSEFVHYLRDIQEETRRSINCISGFVRMVLSQSQLESISKVCKANVLDVVTFNPNGFGESNDSCVTETFVPQQRHGDFLVKVVLEVMLENGILSQSVYNDTLLAITPILFKPSPSKAEEQLLFSIVHDAMQKCVSSYSAEKTHLQNQVLLMSNDLRLARLQQHEASIFPTEEDSYNLSICAASEMNRSAVDERWEYQSSTRGKSVVDEEYADEIKRLRNKINEQNTRHRAEVERYDFVRQTNMTYIM